MAEELAYCLLHTPKTKCGRNLRDNNFLVSFPKTVISHLDILLKYFHYQYFYLSLSASSDASVIFISKTLSAPTQTSPPYVCPLPNTGIGSSGLLKTSG